jgi:luciferase family oxidoreductase group 1
MIPLSILDLSPIAEGSDAGRALRNSLDLARHAERWDYRRYWLAEHHNMAGIASAATAVAIGFIAGGTATIRVGSGGIMLPNHSPLVIAEQFGTLEALYPARIDLGVGRAPGTDMITARALRRDLAQAAERFPQDVVELMALLEPARPDQAIRAVPGAGSRVPIYILGSSQFGAQLAAALGLPFAFASHFAPAQLRQALAIYRERFTPSERLARPYAMVGVNAFAAETDREAERLFTSLQQAFLNLRRGRPGPLPAPLDRLPGDINEAERAGLAAALSVSLVGSPATVRDQLAAVAAETGADELIVTGQIHDHEARLRSFEIVADARKSLEREAAQPAPQPSGFAPDDLLERARSGA